MVDFGLALKIYRASRSISQSDLVSLITTRDAKLSGVDVVTISRWENSVVLPSHKRQIDVFRALDYCYFEFINKHRDVIKGVNDFHRIRDAYVWEKSSSVNFSEVNYQQIKLKVVEDGIDYCLLYTDMRGIPVGHLSYKLMSDIERNCHFKNEKTTEKSSAKLLIKSIFCLSEEIIIHMLGVVTRYIFNREVDCVTFCSGNKKSSVKRFLKSIGFKTNSESTEFSSMEVTYCDVLFNKELFSCAIKLISEECLHESR